MNFFKLTLADEGIETFVNLSLIYEIRTIAGREGSFLYVSGVEDGEYIHVKESCSEILNGYHATPRKI